jgi:hypothetical protein
MHFSARLAPLRYLAEANPPLEATILACRR